MGMNPALTLMAAGSAAPAFAPDDVGGLRSWFDASDATTITASGSDVTQWADKSSYADHATEGTAGLYPQTGANTKNGKNVLTFSNDRIVIGTGYAVGGGSPGSYYVVAMKDAVTNFSVLLGHSDSGANWMGFNNSSSAGAPNCRFTSSSTTCNSSASLTPTNWAILRYTHNGGTTNAQTCGFNDANVGTANAVSEGTVTYKYIGRYGSTTYSLKGRIAEILIYDTVLGATDDDNVISYLNTKWAVY